MSIKTMSFYTVSDDYDNETGDQTLLVAGIVGRLQLRDDSDSNAGRQNIERAPERFVFMPLNKLVEGYAIGDTLNDGTYNYELEHIEDVEDCQEFYIRKKNP